MILKVALCGKRCKLFGNVRNQQLGHLIALLILLASSTSYLVICTDQEDERQQQIDNPLFSNDQFRSLEALDKNDASELRHQEELLRISSELCVRFPHKCRPVGGYNSPASTNDCVSYGLEPVTNRLVCVSSAMLREASELEALLAFQRPEVDTFTKSLPPWPKAGMQGAPYEVIRAEEEDSGKYTTTAVGSTNQTSGGNSLDQLGQWGEPIRGGGGGGSSRLQRMATSFMARQPARLGATIAVRSLRDPHRATMARQQQQRRLQQLKMRQQIMSALPSAFAIEDDLELRGSASSSSAPSASLRARSMRQHRSGQRLPAAATATSQPSLQVPKRTATGDDVLGGGGGGSTTSGQTIQEQTTTTAATLSGNEEAMQCNMRQFTFTATKTDERGNKCSGSVAANICYGGCDTGEIADWLFPGKKSIHKVCRHGARIRRRAILTNCTGPSLEFEGSDRLREYYYVDARDCVCKKCTSADTTCLGTMSQPYLQTALNGGGGSGGSSSSSFLSNLVADDELVAGGEISGGGGGGD